MKELAEKIQRLINAYRVGINEQPYPSKEREIYMGCLINDIEVECKVAIKS